MIGGTVLFCICARGIQLYIPATCIQAPSLHNTAALTDFEAKKYK